MNIVDNVSTVERNLIGELSPVVFTRKAGIESYSNSQYHSHFVKRWRRSCLYPVERYKVRAARFSSATSIRRALMPVLRQIFSANSSTARPRFLRRKAARI